MFAEGALSVHVLSAGSAPAHHDLIDEEVDEEVVSEPSERLELHLDLRLVHLLHLVRERGCHTDMHTARAQSALPPHSLACAMTAPRVAARRHSAKG